VNALGRVYDELQFSGVKHPGSAESTVSTRLDSYLEDRTFNLPDALPG